MSRPLRTNISKSSLILMGIPKHFCDVTLDDFKEYKDVKEAKAFVKDYIDNLVDNIENNNGIFFCGSNGVGKTMLSCIIMKEAYKHRYSCRRVTFSKYIGYYTDGWSKDKESVEELTYEKFKGAEFLVLEEVGKEIDSKIAKPILEDLLRYREEQGFVTIICSNSDLAEFKNHYGNSICSLINGNMTIISIEAKDRRSK